MQVGKEKAPEGKFVDGEGDDATALPVIESGNGSMGEQGRELRFELFQPVEVADEGREVTGEQSQRETPRQIVDKRDGAAKGQSKQSLEFRLNEKEGKGSLGLPKTAR